MRRAFTVWLAVVVLSACGRTADIELRDGRVVQGEITGGDRETIYVRTADGEGEASAVLQQSLARSDIEDVDHPGDTARWVGVGLLGATAVLAVAAAIMFSHAHDSDTALSDDVATGYLLVGPAGYLFIAGTVVLGTSLDRGAKSRRAMQTPPREPEP